MERQEIFDQTVYHLSEQNRPARESSGFKWHKLRLVNGNAVHTSPAGHFIDYRYMPEMEFFPVIDVIDQFPDCVPDWFAEEAEFLQEVEELHDSLPGDIDHPWGPDDRAAVRGHLLNFAETWELDDGKVWNHFWLHDRIQGKTLGERIATELPA